MESELAGLWLAAPASPGTTPGMPTMARTTLVPGARLTAWLAASVGSVAVAVCVALAIWDRIGDPPPSSKTVGTQTVSQPPLELYHEPKPTQIVLNGTWTGSSESVFTMHATLVVDGTRLTGQIRWRLIGIPPGMPDMIDKGDTVGVEEVTGSLSDTELMLAGTSISDPTWLGVGIFRVRLNADDQTFQVSNVEGEAVSGSGNGTYVIVK